jgi:hypothetical protein
MGELGRPLAAARRLAVLASTAELALAQAERAAQRDLFATPTARARYLGFLRGVIDELARWRVTMSASNPLAG